MPPATTTTSRCGWRSSRRAASRRSTRVSVRRSASGRRAARATASTATRPTRTTATPGIEQRQQVREPGRSAIGTWSGGRFLHFGEAIEEDRLAALLRPGDGIDTVLTADAYGQGEADRVLGRALEGVARGAYSLVGAVGHDFYEGE